MDNNTIEASSSPPASPSPSNHIGVGVPDLNKAVRWYHEVLGFNIVTEPMEGSADDSHLGMILKDILGHHLRNYD
jgi:catechol 2,3-dioxygenase-like lactoylglutathione lyase family enzyme